MKRYLYSLCIVTMLGLSACATTPSKPLSFEQLGQFQTVPLNKHTYRISFKAKPNMTFAHAEEITLVQAAKTSLQQGFEFFKVLDDPSNRSQQAPRQAVVYASPMHFPYGYGYRRGYWLDPFYETPRVVNVEPIQIAYSIECYRQDQAPKDAFDARLILQALGGKYGLTATGEAIAQPPVS